MFLPRSLVFFEFAALPAVSLPPDSSSPSSEQFDYQNFIGENFHCGCLALGKSRIMEAALSNTREETRQGVEKRKLAPTIEAPIRCQETTCTAGRTTFGLYSPLAACGAPVFVSLPRGCTHAARAIQHR